MRFRLHTQLKPAGDQPQAIEKLTENILAGAKHQVLLGVTGSGKTFTIASVIEGVQRPTLVISHNKTLAWQLYQEFKELFPENAVEYFVSYYDYYQPEAYIPQSDTYIDKDARINEKIDRMRHKAVQSILTRPDTIVVASVSCIYNLGSPEEYQQVTLNIKEGQKWTRPIKTSGRLGHPTSNGTSREFLRALVNLGYTRNDIDPRAGNFRAKGARIEIYPATGEGPIIVTLEDGAVQHISQNTKEKLSVVSGQLSVVNIFPAHFWITPEQKLRAAMHNIRQELDEQVAALRAQNKLVEAQRLQQRTAYDLELMEHTGWCHGIENYSRHMEFRAAGSPPFTLLDYFAGSKGSREALGFLGLPDYPRKLCENGFLTIIDESHMTLPQLRGMHAGDRARKEMLVQYGFRLPSAIDNRPLNFDEFERRVGQTICVSATPGVYEIQKSQIRNSKFEIHPHTKIWCGGKNPNSKIQNSKHATRYYIIEQLVRPTGLLEPAIEIRHTKDQMRDAIQEIEKRVAKQQRVLVITLTKRLSEDIAEYLADEGVKVQYLHSEVQTLERPQILNDLREGKYDVLVGINLLREGLDLPETSLVIIFDADKEGFLRNETTLIQIMGRAARHVEGRVIMYADIVTGSMKAAMKEVERRRAIQEAYNKKHGITPRTISKKIYALPEWFAKPVVQTPEEHLDSLSRKELERQMKQAAKNMDFERAAHLRDSIKRLEASQKKPST